jgi:hypothetical protein
VRSDDLPVSPVYDKQKKKHVKFEQRRDASTMQQYRKRQKDLKLEKIEKTKRGNHMLHGINTNVWDHPFFK